MSGMDQREEDVGFVQQQEMGSTKSQSSIYQHVSGAIRRVLAAIAPSSISVLLFFLALLLGALISTRWIKGSMISNGDNTITTVSNPIITPTTNKSLSKWPQAPFHPPAIPFTCPSTGNLTTHICKSTSTQEAPPPTSTSLPTDPLLSTTPACPAYFRWIHEDLRPWKQTGISKEMVEGARKDANFRLVVLGGKVYMEQYSKAFQTRDVFTLWGILQLIRRYPGRLPDLDLMFNCDDMPVVKSADYRGRNVSVPPLFRYCSDNSATEIVFPDWSFWGWPEINIKPWEPLLRELKEGNERLSWMDRDPHAYWKGNPSVAPTRWDLLKCSASRVKDWNARIYAQDWNKESQQGFKESDLAHQCTHRYKIYIEGRAWSVSEKYILACDSMTLFVKSRYYDFFTRGLMPVKHYWPIRDNDKCRSIKFAVDWGNAHKLKAQAIGKEGSDFIQEKLKMDYIYDYMFHLLTEYAKLLSYKPTIPQGATELCSESMACPAKGLEKKFMMDSMVNGTHDSGPCTLPPPFDPVELKGLLRRNANFVNHVEMLEQKSKP